MKRKAPTTSGLADRGISPLPHVFFSVVPTSKLDAMLPADCGVAPRLAPDASAATGADDDMTVTPRPATIRLNIGKRLLTSSSIPARFVQCENRKRLTSQPAALLDSAFRQPYMAPDIPPFGMGTRGFGFTQPYLGCEAPRSCLPLPRSPPEQFSFRLMQFWIHMSFTATSHASK